MDALQVIRCYIGLYSIFAIDSYSISIINSKYIIKYFIIYSS